MKNSSAVPHMAMGCSVFSYSMYPLALLMGGRNQKTHGVRSECAAGAAGALASALLVVALPLKAPSLVDFSAVGVLEPLPPPNPASKGLAPDLGVLADPKEAKAPEPRPKALDALVGLTRPLPGVVAELKGLLFPWEEVSPPKRLEKLALRLADSLCPELDVDRESLLELEKKKKGLVRIPVRGQREESKLSVVGRERTEDTYFVRRVHRLSIKKAGEGEGR